MYIVRVGEPSFKAHRMSTTNLVVVSDLHCGCRVGLCPPGPIRLDGGGTYSPSKFQKKVWRWWLDFWQEWVPQATHGEPFDLVINGDVLDGVHHRSTTQISQDIEDQVEIARAAVKLPISLCERLYWIRGTEAHVGPSGVHEERIAKDFAAVPDDEGRHARFELWKQVGEALVHVTHHIGTTGRAAYESSAPQAELIAMLAEAGRWRDAPPHFVVRSHRHRFIKVTNPGERRLESIVTPGWQGKTPFVHKIPGGRVSQPQFGGILIRQGDAEFFSRERLYKLSRSKVEA